MGSPPHPLPVYHITHVDNLAAIVSTGGLLSDAAMIAQGGPTAPIGMNTIKQRRLRLPVKCHPGDAVGDYVPFNFCPRSIMLSVIYYANNPDLVYRGGQDPIVHLEFDLHEIVAASTAGGGRWAFTLANAGAAYTEFRSDIAQLTEVDWIAVANSDFSSAAVKEAKQAEFLVLDHVPWSLVRRVGVRTAATQARAVAALDNAEHQPPVDVIPRWYF
jgi:ssDNA thymidine ADP-ribosyltransferase, DarT